MIEIILNLVKSMAKHPTLTKDVAKVRGSVYEKIADLDATCVKSAEPISYADLDKHTFVPIKEGDLWADQHFDCAWFKLRGKVPAGTAHPVIVFNVNGEGMAHHNGESFDISTPLLGVSGVLQPPGIGKRIFDLDGKVDEDGNFEILVDCGNNGITGTFVFKPKYVYGYLANRRDNVLDFYYDYLTLALLLSAEENSSFTPEVNATIKKALARAYKYFKKEDVDGAKAVLAPFYNDSSVEHKTINKLIAKRNPVDYTMVGHAHLDLAWLWPKRETMRKTMRTFTNAISLIEKDKNFVFGASQAQMFEWVKEQNPSLYAKIKKAVEDGNIEIQGGMWTECDCNLTGGESIIRQFGYGDKFFLDNFGKTSNVMWLPDVFGYPATLPQIIRGVGKDYFATIKLSWNKTNKFPLQTFKWLGPDGSEVVAHLSPEGTYCNDATPLVIAKTNRKNLQKAVGKALVIYGDGDGGGGAGEGHVEVIERERKLYDKGKVEFGSAESFFDKLDGNLPSYQGELYLEKHRGTYTSQSENKRLNRACEHALHTLEWLCVASGDTNKNLLDKTWKTVLFNQFHDILPGSSIERVHRESREELNSALNDANNQISALIDGFGGVKSLCAINPSPFAQTVMTEIDGQTYSANVPAYASAPLKKTAHLHPFVAERNLENNLVRIVFDKDGNIISYFDKVQGVEHAKGLLNQFVVYGDKKLHYNAWDIDNDYLKHKNKVKCTGSRFYTEGVYSVVEHSYAYGNSTIVEKVKLGATSQVQFDLVVDWKETHKMLRTEFEPADYGDTVECDIQFGSILRPTTENNSVEKEQFEICAHKYIATSGRGIFALYSNSKYGYRAKNGMLTMNLFRSPVYPDPTCDRMVHHLTYAMDIPQSRKDLVRGAYNFNLPVIITDKEVDLRPIATTTSSNLIIETIKPAEDGDGFALRIYERYGARTEADLVLTVPYTALYESNLLEKIQVPTTEHLTFKPHEIKTIVVKTK